jgi:hypothetical protein
MCLPGDIASPRHHRHKPQSFPSFSYPQHTTPHIALVGVEWLLILLIFLSVYVYVYVYVYVVCATLCVIMCSVYSVNLTVCICIYVCVCCAVRVA